MDVEKIDENQSSKAEDLNEGGTQSVLAFEESMPNPLKGSLSDWLSLYLTPSLLTPSLLAGSTLMGSPLLSFPNTLPGLLDIAKTSTLTFKREEARNYRVSTPAAKAAEKIVPNTDKEGWCRNKKYIAKIPNGFMCTVCKKVYGRYNSVSYHVTIYHRNPPIKCGMEGCDFTTREARYIHFHKYYRHGIELPDSIDLGSRRCPHCRHVSKSPAMLEKHLSRHETKEKHVTQTSTSPSPTHELIIPLPEHNPNTSPEQSVQDSAETSSPREDRPSDDDTVILSDHESSAERESKDSSTHMTAEESHLCAQCNFRADSPSQLTQHLLFSHPPPIVPSPCLLCPFTAPSSIVLAYHTLTLHILPCITYNNA